MSSSSELNDYMTDNESKIRDGLNWKGVFASDKLPSPNTSDFREGFCMIINYDPSYKSGSHWVALRVSGTGESGKLSDRSVHYFDSYGENMDRDNEILNDRMDLTKYVNTQIPHTKFEYNDYDFQSIGTDVCGLYSAYFCLNDLPDVNPEAWADFHKAPKAVIDGKSVKLNSPYSKDNDELIKRLVHIKLAPLGKTQHSLTPLTNTYSFTGEGINKNLITSGGSNMYMMGRTTEEVSWGSGIKMNKTATQSFSNLGENKAGSVSNEERGSGFYKKKTVSQIKENPTTQIQAVRFEKQLTDKQIKGLNKRGTFSEGSETHGVVFDKGSWSVEQASKWLSEHNFKPIKPVDITAHQLRFRMIEPSEFKDFRYKYLGDGISLILGFHKELAPPTHIVRKYEKKNL